jgi:DNA-binding transcriptional MerR regulator
LREKLEFLYPGTPIPPISKKGQYRRYDEKHLQKRLIILEMFLNKIVNMAELKSEVMVENFLLIKEKATF